MTDKLSRPYAPALLRFVCVDETQTIWIDPNCIKGVFPSSAGGSYFILNDGHTTTNVLGSPDEIAARLGDK